VLDTSKGRKPLSYLHGRGNIVPGLEAALEGKSSGESFEITVPPDQGYGEHNESLVVQVDRGKFQGVDEIEPGMRFQAQTQDGTHILTVVDVEDQAVTVDANHPLAGQNLNFDVTVVEVRDATEDERREGKATRE
jgi:FKBP-type peptidyl-prolyl cis-trans isomerase SlyD